MPPAESAVRDGELFLLLQSFALGVLEGDAGELSGGMEQDIHWIH